jgi:hypothetical protein
MHDITLQLKSFIEACNANDCAKVKIFISWCNLKKVGDIFPTRGTRILSVKKQLDEFAEQNEIQNYTL